MFKTTILLKQHTPIIHFQHDQEGATLRATEVKPKLDRFLIDKMGKDWKDLPPSWKTGGGVDGQKALDYKLKVIATNVSMRDIETEHYDDRKGGMVEDKHPGFFANMNESIPKRFSETKDDIQITVFTFNKQLKDFIEKHWETFFIYENFGTRQSKGFGCFLPKNLSALPSDFYSFSVPSKDIKTVFATIEMFYKTLRGGINGFAHPNPGSRMEKGFVKGFYLKPMIFQYAASQKIRWEKRAIKERYFSNKPDKLTQQIRDENNKRIEAFEPSPLHYDQGDPRIVRDWLGISTDQTWMKYPQENIKKTHTKQNGSRVNKNDAIARMKSPITFKPIEETNGYRVYFYAHLDPEVKNTLKNAGFKITANGSGNLELNMWENFDLKAFLEFAFVPGRIEQSIRYGNDHNQVKAKVIEKEIIRIYNDIRKSKPNA